jgi:hypothetical protein
MGMNQGEQILVCILLCDPWEMLAGPYDDVKMQVCDTSTQLTTFDLLLLLLLLLLVLPLLLLCYVMDATVGK